MKVNAVTLILAISFLFPIVLGLLSKYSSNSIKRNLEGICKSISFLLALAVGIHLSKQIFIIRSNKYYSIIYENIPQKVTEFIQKNPIALYIIVMPLMIYVLYVLVKAILIFINKITIFRILDRLETSVAGEGNKRILSALTEVPAGICYLLLVTFCLNIFSMFNTNKQFTKYLDSSKPYKYLCENVVLPVTNSTIAKSLPSIIDNSFKVVIKDSNGINIDTNSLPDISTLNNKNVVIYYNGITLDQAIKSNSEIDSYAKELVGNETKTISKARRLYNWVGKNISYDNEKANKVLNNDYNVESGAIPTFATRKGICFDYASLYTAMCRADGIKVRIVTGQGFNGVNWVSHAWNQVFITEENRWINVDCTFASGGNYFDTTVFAVDHRGSQVIGEW
ncbi:MAG: transglutaminase-like domain-containing protein [Bacillota bacterium]|nr:transglutaminase-like domain-containing protein [Bacillota bacterium]